MKEKNSSNTLPFMKNLFLCIYKYVKCSTRDYFKALWKMEAELKFKAAAPQIHAKQNKN